MNLVLIRKYYGDSSTEGAIYINGVHECFTLEDKDRNLEFIGEVAKVAGETAIPKGIYPIKITKSNRFKKDLPLLLNVPYFTGVRIHTGNKSEDTEGCILVGATNSKSDDDWISNSKVAFDKLFEKIKTALDNDEEVKIIVS